MLSKRKVFSVLPIGTALLEAPLVGIILIGSDSRLQLRSGRVHGRGMLRHLRAGLPVAGLPFGEWRRSTRIGAFRYESPDGSSSSSQQLPINDG